MIKTNQILSVGWSLSIGIIRGIFEANQYQSLKRYVKCSIQSQNQQNHHRPSPLLLSMVKKVKEALRTRLSGTKLLELKPLLDQKNSPNEKPY